MQSATLRLKVIVRDTGIGIPEADLGKIFQMYSRVDCEHHKQVCGLGLSISSALVDKLGGGKIEVRSCVGKGSTFSFEIDVTETTQTGTRTPQDDETVLVEEEPQQSVFVPKSVASVHDFDQPHRYPEILIVDDAPFNRIVLRRMLESGGYLCDEAATGLQAVALVQRRQTQGRPFRLVLMDVDMPEMDGISATRTILASGDATSPVIVCCSAYSAETDKSAALEAGMRVFLEKPVARVALMEVARNYV